MRVTATCRRIRLTVRSRESAPAEQSAGTAMPAKLRPLHLIHGGASVCSGRPWSGWPRAGDSACSAGPVFRVASGRGSQPVPAGPCVPGGLGPGISACSGGALCSGWPRAGDLSLFRRGPVFRVASGRGSQPVPAGPCVPGGLGPGISACSGGALCSGWPRAGDLSLFRRGPVFRVASGRGSQPVPAGPCVPDWPAAGRASVCSGRACSGRPRAGMASRSGFNPQDCHPRWRGVISRQRTERAAACAATRSGAELCGAPLTAPEA